jgi:uncharacterized protein YhfF
MTPDCFSFAGGGDLGDRLLALVLSGRKRATASLPIEYTGVGESLPLSGDLTIVLDSQGRPSAIIERTSVRVVAFEEVSPEFAKREGEGDGSLKYWREAHARYFGTVCKRFGGTIEPETAVLCQEFELVWPVT